MDVPVCTGMHEFHCLNQGMITSFAYKHEEEDGDGNEWKRKVTFVCAYFCHIVYYILLRRRNCSQEGGSRKRVQKVYVNVCVKEKQGEIA